MTSVLLIFCFVFLREIRGCRKNRLLCTMAAAEALLGKTGVEAKSQVSQSEKNVKTRERFIFVQHFASSNA